MTLLKTGIHCLDFKMLYTNYFLQEHFLKNVLNNSWESNI